MVKHKYRLHLIMMKKSFSRLLQDSEKTKVLLTDESNVYLIMPNKKNMCIVGFVIGPSQTTTMAVIYANVNSPLKIWL